MGTALLSTGEVDSKLDSKSVNVVLFGDIQVVSSDIVLRVNIELLGLSLAVSIKLGTFVLITVAVEVDVVQVLSSDKHIGIVVFHCPFSEHMIVSLPTMM